MQKKHDLLDQLIPEESHLSMYKFEPHLWVPCLSLQSLPRYDDFLSARRSKHKITSKLSSLYQKYSDVLHITHVDHMSFPM